MRHWWYAIAIASGASSGSDALAQTAEAKQLDAIIVTAPRSALRVQPPQLRLSNAALRDRQPKLATDALRGLPGVSIRPNSRGESVVRVRGSEERQTAVFLDGAPLSVPWDGRVDLGVLPAGLVGAIGVTKGAVPIEYGTNAVAGVVDLQTARDENAIEGEISGGSRGSGTLSAFGQWNSGIGDARVLDTTLAAGYVTRDAQPVADIDALPFSQRDRDARTNTDLDTRSLFAATGIAHGDTLWRVSLLHADMERGIAPEGHLDPANSSPRYWRYPDWRLTQLNLAGETTLAESLQVRGVAWRQWFEQTIDAYRSDRYDTLRSREQDEDDTLGARVTLSHPLGPLSLRWSATAQSSTHKQIDTPFPSAIPGPQLRYRQNLRSIGVESDWPISPTLRTTLGLGYDQASTPLTGDKPAQQDQHAPTYSAALAWEIDSDWTLTFSSGRRTRFPSARELFGEALGRFLVNPDLDPETATLFDLEASWQSGDSRLSINPFYQRSKGTLTQRVVVVNGRSLRQRFNLPGSRAYGLDIYAGVPLHERLTMEAGGSWLRTHADPSADFSFRHLPQRPDYELFVALDWQTWHDLDLRTELRRVGSAFDIGPTGQAISLRAGTELNLRATLPLFEIGKGRRIDLIFSVDNITNAVIEPQLGLPLPGRTYRLGWRL